MSEPLIENRAQWERAFLSGHFSREPEVIDLKSKLIDAEKRIDTLETTIKWALNVLRYYMPADSPVLNSAEKELENSKPRTRHA